MLNYVKGNKVSWKDIYLHGEKSNYRVSSAGDIKDRFTGKSLDQHTDEDGSLFVIIENKDKIHRVRVHKLVAKSFIPNPSGWLCVRHKNGNKSDNHVSNLEWDTTRGWM